MTESNRKGTVARYRPDISLGNILTLLGMVTAVVSWGLRLEGRVDGQQQIGALQQQNVELRFQHLEGRVSQQKEDFERALSNINSALERIETKLDRKVDKQ